jgi:hypothetical protein
MEYIYTNLLSTVVSFTPLHPLTRRLLASTAAAYMAATSPPSSSPLSLFTLFAWLISHQPAVLFSQNKPTTSNQPTVLFSHNKLAPAISQTNRVIDGACR